MDVDRDARGDRQHPGAQVLAVLEPVVGAQGPEERLLEGVVGAVAPELAPQQPEHLGAVLVVERLERRDRHCGHHP